MVVCGWPVKLCDPFVSASRVQDRRARAAIACWCCSRVSCWWLSFSVWRWASYAKVSFQWHPEAARATNTQQTWRQEFIGSRSSTVEQSSSSIRTAAAGTFLQFFKTMFENTSLWQLKRLVTFDLYALYKYMYLSIYLSHGWYLSPLETGHNKALYKFTWFIFILL